MGRVYVGTQTLNGPPSLTGVAIIDTATNQVNGQITLPHDPTVLAVSPDGSRLYGSTTGAGAEDRIEQIYAVDLSDNSAFQIIDSVRNPFGIAFSPDSQLVYVVSSTTTSSSVVILNAASAQVITQIPLPAGVYYGIAMAPGGERAFVAPFLPDSFGDKIVAVDLVNRTVDTTFDSSLPENAILVIDPKVRPDGQFLYVPFLG
jgi:DNA-binding beta-propeller fold protein YncE